MQSAIFQAHQEVAQRPCRQKRSIVQATRAVLENEMAALDLCSHGLTKFQMREELYQADPTLMPGHRARGRTRLAKLKKPQLLLAAAASGIDVIGLTLPQIRMKLVGWEPTLPAEPAPAAERPTTKTHGVPSQLMESRSQRLPAEHPTETMRVFCQMARPELQHAAAAKGIDVFGLTCDELRCKLADCTPSQLKRFKSRCPLLERQTVSWAVLAGMAKAELQRAAAA